MSKREQYTYRFSSAKEACLLGVFRIRNTEASTEDTSAQSIVSVLASIVTEKQIPLDLKVNDQIQYTPDDQINNPKRRWSFWSITVK